MPALRVVIADDEPLARERLQQLLALQADVEVVAECATGRETLAAVGRTAPDLLFLDVTMPDLDGFGVIEALPQPAPAVVFVTAHQRFALKAFEVRAADFLLKPFDGARLATTLLRARQRLRREGPPTSTAALLGLARRLRTPERAALGLTARIGGRRAIVRFADITWIEAEGNYCVIHRAGEPLRRKEPLSRLAERLPAGHFVRISRSAVVNVDHVRELRPKSHGDALLVLAGGTILTVSRAHRAEVAARLQRPATA